MSEVDATPDDPPGKRGDLPAVCVVTHPLAAAGENATRTLLDVLAAVTGVSLVTADLPADSAIRDDREVIELTTKSAGESIPVAAARFLLNQVRMCLVLRRRPEPVVLFFGATSYLLPTAFARLIGKTVIVEPRGDVPLTLRLNWERRVPAPVARLLAGGVWWLERVCYHLADGIVTYTPSMAEGLDLDDFEGKLYPTGARYVDTERFAPRVPFEDREAVVGFVGRLDEEKRIRELAGAVPHLPEDLRVRFVGDGPLREWLETELAAAIDAGRVEVPGWVDHDDVPRELNRMRLLVLPSHPTEGLPTTILESLACGTPVCATPVSGVPDVVLENETGFLLREVDPEGIAEVVERATGADLAELGRNGREHVEANYSFEAAKDRYEAILWSVTHGSPDASDQ